MLRVIVNNVSDYGMSKPYIAAKIYENELWYWNAWDDEQDAEIAAKECGGIVVFNDMEG